LILTGPGRRALQFFSNCLVYCGCHIVLTTENNQTYGFLLCVCEKNYNVVKRWRKIIDYTLVASSVAFSPACEEVSCATDDFRPLTSTCKPDSSPSRASFCRRKDALVNSKFSKSLSCCFVRSYKSVSVFLEMKLWWNKYLTSNQ